MRIYNIAHNMHSKEIFPLMPHIQHQYWSSGVDMKVRKLAVFAATPTWYKILSVRSLPEFIIVS